ncbi:hypothetical protein BOTBODRAFT_377122 [Botryobasidium botryosum FD-172 SS1]|uniref:Uncharacterized protein n=1 Tax=Botryobasidium botryosum (strain FD-172 SS1) TaxID=930990 RepID=A0A067MVL7_BOTB1|nr:hypothetical protein BOTBODRAFT_377122 [Botryobasidium botryosum FD-172 SS1]
MEALPDDSEPPSPDAPVRPRLDDVERVFDTQVFSEAPRVAALVREAAPKYREATKKNFEAFRTLTYFSPFLLGFKRGDGIPRVRDA